MVNNQAVQLSSNQIVINKTGGTIKVVYHQVRISKLKQFKIAFYTTNIDTLSLDIGNKVYTIPYPSSVIFSWLKLNRIVVDLGRLQHQSKLQEKLEILSGRPIALHQTLNVRNT